jgi:hypothetical protein
VELAEAGGGAVQDAVQAARCVGGGGLVGQGGAWWGLVGQMGRGGGDVPWWTVAGCEQNGLCCFGGKNTRWL